MLLLDTDTLAVVYRHGRVYESERVKSYLRAEISDEFVFLQKVGEGWSEMINMRESNHMRQIDDFISCPFYKTGTVLASGSTVV